MTSSLHRTLMMAALTLAPRSAAFGGDPLLRGFVSRIASKGALSLSSFVSSASCRRSFLASSRIAAIRGGDGRRSSSLHGSSPSSANEFARTPLPASFEGRREDLTAALEAVYAACRVTRHVQPTSSKSVETISKKDASPVTVGDFASQALALQVLHDRFPYDMFIAEEGSEALQEDAELLERVREAADHVLDKKMSRKQLCSAIDYGQGIDDGSIENDDDHKQRSAASKRRVWCLDPIDGTKGFLRGRLEGGQYCIALALIENGVPVLSVLGCPNLPLPYTPATGTVPYGMWSEYEVEESEDGWSPFSMRRGCLFVAVRGCGCYEIPLHLIEDLLDDDAPVAESKAWTRLHVTANDGSTKPTSQATFCLGVERGFSDPKGTVLKIAQAIHGPDALTTGSDGVQDIKNSMRLDGQGKYGLLARGDAEYFLRLPKDGYVDWVWDVAAGYLILKEAGGTMTDVHGKPIDFSEIGIGRRAKLPDHVRGILGSCGGVFHEALVDAYAKLEDS